MINLPFCSLVWEPRDW